MLCKSSVTDAGTKRRSTGEVSYSCSIPNLLSSDNTCDAAKREREKKKARPVSCSYLQELFGLVNLVVYLRHNECFVVEQIGRSGGTAEGT